MSWVPVHTFVGGEQPALAVWQALSDDDQHLKDRTDRQCSVAGGGTAIAPGNLCVASSGADNRVVITTTQGQAGPVWVALDSLPAGGTAGYVRSGGFATVLTAGSVAVGAWLRPSASAGSAEACSANSAGIFGQAITGGTAAGSVTAALLPAASAYASAYPLRRSPITGTFGNSNVPATATRYGGMGAFGLAATRALVQGIMPADGTLRNLYIVTSGTQPASGGLGATLEVNGTATSVVGTVVAGGTVTSFSDTAHSATTPAGAFITIALVNNGTAQSITLGGYALEFDPT